jgi:putative ABC transport system permease protein
MLSGSGALVGTALGVALIVIASRVWTGFPLRPSPGWITTVLVLALTAGIGFGLMPARRAAGLDVVEALRGRR